MMSQRITTRNTHDGTEYRVSVDLDGELVGWACRFGSGRTWQMFVIGCNQATGEACGTTTSKRDAVEWLTSHAARRGMFRL